jgi:hypothetical protein
VRRRLKPKEDVEWNFYSFPCLASLCLGAFTAVLLYQFLAPIIFVVSLFGVSFCLAHMVSRLIRNKTIAKRVQEAEEDEREKRALAARAANAQAGEASSKRRRRRRV